MTRIRQTCASVVAEPLLNALVLKAHYNSKRFSSYALISKRNSKLEFFVGSRKTGILQARSSIKGREHTGELCRSFKEFSLRAFNRPIERYFLMQGSQTLKASDSAQLIWAAL